MTRLVEWCAGAHSFGWGFALGVSCTLGVLGLVGWWVWITPEEDEDAS